MVGRRLLPKPTGNGQRLWRFPLGNRRSSKHFGMCLIMIDYKITNTAPTEARGEWQAVSKESPCPQCQKPDWCTVGVRWIHCMRVESSRPCARGGWLHPKDADPSSALAPLPPRQKRVSDEEMAAKWGPIAAMAAKYGECRLRVLAQQLGVSEGALLRLGVGYALFDGEGAWTFPERNPEGLIVGIVRRTVVGKLCCKGSRRGLSFCDEWDEFRGPTFLCEGGSDVAAGLTLGLRIIGRTLAGWKCWHGCCDGTTTEYLSSAKMTKRTSSTSSNAVRTTHRIARVACAAGLEKLARYRPLRR